MKKLLVVNTKYKISGGEDSSILDELTFLEKKYKVHYLEFDNSKKLNFFDLLAFIFNSNYFSNKKLNEVIYKFKPDVAYVHNTWFIGNLGIFKILKNKKINTILKLHNFRYDCSRYWLLKNHLRDKEFCPACSLKNSKTRIFNKYFQESYFKSLFSIIYSKRYFKILKTFPIQILVFSKFHKTYLINQGVKESKLNIFYNPINLNSEKDIVYNPKSKYVVYAGRLTDSKGVYELIKTWNESNISGITLKIIGKGDLERELITKFNKDGVEFLGELSNSETISYIKNSLAVLTATKMYEGQPRLLSEASNFGVPSIYPSFGGMDEFFPKNYSFSFRQYDYQSLKKQIENLKKTDDLSQESKKVYLYLNKKLDEELMHNLFYKIIQKEM